MDVEHAKSLSYKTIRKLYKNYLERRELGPNTVGTVTGDTFYLWNNAGKEVFWDTVFAAEFEKTARSAFTEVLTNNSSGDVLKLLNGYIGNLRRFRDFILTTETEPEKDDATALKEFLLDIECLDPLAEWTSKFNIFDILKISRVEIRHSNMLAWLLNPNENHGLGDSVLRGFIQYVIVSSEEDTDIFEKLLMDCHDFIVQREWHSIDILASSEKERFVICIENKIDSGEHDDQLNRYRKIVEDNFPGYEKMFIYLTPKGEEVSDPINWYVMSYQDVLNVIENAKRKAKLLPEAELLIGNYTDTLRRDIVGDERLAKICAEIYNKHQKALDLIFENRPDRASDVADIFKRWAAEKEAQGKLIYDARLSGKTSVRFKTAKMSKILPDAEDAVSAWGTHNFYFYHISNIDGKEFFMQLVLNAQNIPKRLRDVCDRINEFYPSKKRKTNWQWHTVYTTKHSKIEDEVMEEKIFEQLDKKLEEILAFEDKLAEKLGVIF